jgi:hypothetical protein
MFGIMLALAVMLVGAPAASANNVTAEGKITVYAINATTGDSVPQATVAVYKANSPTVGTPILKGQTNSEGVFVSYIPAGKYRVVVAADGFNEYSQVITVEKGYNTQIKAPLTQSTSDR